jgi:bacillithiol system protein YtxJ
MVDLAAVDEAVVLSYTGPVVVFKHSATCGTSAMAHEEIEDLVAAQAVGTPIFIVPVHARRGVSNAITTRFGIRHESPQVLILDRGQVVWSASHFRVTAAHIARMLDQLRRTLAPTAST